MRFLCQRFDHQPARAAHLLQARDQAQREQGRAAEEFIGRPENHIRRGFGLYRDNAQHMRVVGAKGDVGRGAGADGYLTGIGNDLCRGAVNPRIGRQPRGQNTQGRGVQILHQFIHQRGNLVDNHIGQRGIAQIDQITGAVRAQAAFGRGDNLDHSGAQDCLGPKRDARRAGHFEHARCVALTDRFQPQGAARVNSAVNGRATMRQQARAFANFDHRRAQGQVARRAGGRGKDRIAAGRRDLAGRNGDTGLHIYPLARFQCQVLAIFGHVRVDEQFGRVDENIACLRQRTGRGGGHAPAQFDGCQP